MATNYTGNATPTLNNAPANSWATDAEKRSHVGNTYLVTGSGGTAGNVYAFEKYPSAVVKEVPASGLPADIVTITDGGENLPMTSAEVSLSPIQDLNGYDSPWPAGGGKNKLNVTASTQTINGLTFTVNDDGTVLVNGTATATTSFNINPSVAIDSSKTYILSGCPIGGSVGNGYSLQGLGGTPYDIGAGSSSFSEITGGGIRIRVASGVACNNLLFKPMIRLASETDDSFAPYSNICPISGHTGAELKRTGKNLLPKTAYQTQTVNGTTFTVNADGSVTVSGTPSAQTRVNLYSGLFWSPTVAEVFSSGTMPTGTRFFAERKRSGSTSYPTLSPTATAQIGDEYRNLLLEVNTTFDGTAFTVYPMIELGSTATAYEPYQGDTYSVTFSDQGTVYGGTYDFVTGKLGVEWVNIDSYNGETITEPWLSSMDVYSAGATPTTGAQVVYKLATPLEYTLTPQQIETLLGENNVWSDAGEISALVYRSNQYVMAYDWFETWTMPKITRDNGQVFVLPYPQEYTPEIYDVDAATSGRNANGTMMRDRVARKHKFNYKYAALSQQDTTEILNAVQDVSFTLTTASPETGAKTNYRVYVGDRSLPVYWMPNHNQNSWLYETLTLNLIEM